MMNNYSLVATLVGAASILQLQVLAQERQRPPAQDQRTDNSVKPITIHEEIDFKVSPRRLYEALIEAKQFGAFSGRKAQIDRTVGGAFSLFDGHIVGRNVELVPNQRIVQAWRVVDWPAGVFSIAKFEFVPKGSGTHLVFDHTGFPDGLHDHLAAGWKSNYWDLLAKYLPH